jgi:hypothetical protein
MKDFEYDRWYWLVEDGKLDGIYKVYWNYDQYVSLGRNVNYEQVFTVQEGGEGFRLIGPIPEPDIAITGVGGY